MAKPRMSRSASAAPRSPATVENRTKASVFLPTSLKIFALVHAVMSFVTVNVPKAPLPLACMRLSGMTSRSKCAIFSKYQVSCRVTGPRLPAVWIFSFCAIGRPLIEVKGFFIVSSRPSRSAMVGPPFSFTKIHSHSCSMTQPARITS
ncbi:hypothetical protein SDC9_80716 [bioreactor metagenome]|uniref:Uncharacterized protein n=1 Tax=bioreactor metagenome TaxID=1076179 RepID=A0A644Z7S1_9ZZZZ